MNELPEELFAIKRVGLTFWNARLMSEAIPRRAAYLEHIKMVINHGSVISVYFLEMLAKLNGLEKVCV